MLQTPASTQLIHTPGCATLRTALFTPVSWLVLASTTVRSYAPAEEPHPGPPISIRPRTRSKTHGVGRHHGIGVGCCATPDIALSVTSNAGPAMSTDIHNAESLGLHETVG